MTMFMVVYILWMTTSVTLSGKPPMILEPRDNSWNQTTVYVRQSDTHIYRCNANGTAPITYKWQLNGSDIRQNWQTAGFDSVTGTLAIGTLFGVLQSGDYQCIVTNKYGTSTTPYLTLLATRAEPFPGIQDSLPEEIEKKVSTYLTLPCTDVPASVPPWTFSWERITITTDGLPVSSKIEPSDRVYVDPKGNLHFVYLETSDGGYSYRCVAVNDVILVTVKNTHSFKLNVIQGVDVDRAPKLKYHDDVEVKPGDDAVLKCAFTYFSTKGEALIIDWKFANKTVKQGTDDYLTLVKPTHDQEGEYTCEAKLGGLLPALGTVNLKIAAPPVFLPNKALQTTKVSVKKDATFQCETMSLNAYTKPPVWLVNNIPLIGCPPHMFECKTPRQVDGYAQCIHRHKRCEKNLDCTDGSDEQNCPLECSDGLRACRDSCIPVTSPCAQTPCIYPSFQCLDNSGCLQKQQRCNGIKECEDHSDENGCENSNGYRITVNRFNLNTQRTELVLPSVTIQDRMCFQCIVGNEYGTVFGDGCLQVIEGITVKQHPRDVYNVRQGQTINIIVDAVTDPEYQKELHYDWIWYKAGIVSETGETITEQEGLLTSKQYSNYFKVSTNGKTLTIILPDVHDEQSTAHFRMLTNNRSYAVNISQPFDSVTLKFNLQEDVGKTGKIEVLVKPDDKYYTEPGQTLNISVDATTDNGDQLRYEWLWYRPKSDPHTKEVILEKEPLLSHPHNKYFQLSSSHKRLEISVPNAKDKVEYEAVASQQQYAVQISTDHDVVLLNFTVIGKTIQVEESVKNTGSDVTSVIVGCIIGGLALVVTIIVTVILCRRHRQDNSGGDKTYVGRCRVAKNNDKVLELSYENPVLSNQSPETMYDSIEP